MRPDQPRADQPTPAAASLDAWLRRLRWTVLRPLAVYLGGDEQSRVRGPGMELTEVREYQPGDDVRFIDWNISARTDRPYIREAHAERALDTWLVIDVSASVDWGTAQCLKRQRAIEFAALAGELLSRHGNRVGALLFADAPLTFVPPSAGRGHLLEMLARLRGAPRQSARAATDLTAALTRVDTILKRRSVVLIVSDFLVPDGWQKVLARLAQRHEVVAVRLTDPRESALPDVGLVTFEDPETGRQLTVDTGDRRLRERFAAAAVAQADALRADLKRHGADTLDLGTDADLLKTLIKFLDQRRAQRSLRARPTP